MGYKLGIVLSTQPAAFSALAYKGRLAENLAKIHALGYDGVELAVRDPRLLDLAQLQSLLQANRLPVIAIGTGQAFGEEGLSFTHPQEAVRIKAIRRVQQHMTLAAALDALIIIGLIRGRRSAEISDEQTQAWLIEALRQCSNDRPGVKMVLEPINRYETDIITTVREGLAFLDALQSDQVGLLLDTFHMNIEEPSLSESIEMAGERLFHFHIADSNRRHPGAGHIDFVQVVRALDRIGYQGYISAEMLPLPDADTAAQQTLIFMKERVFAAL